MKIKAWPMKYVLTAAFGVLAVVIIGGAASHRRVGGSVRTITNHQQEEERVQTTLPEITTSVKDLQVVSAYIDSDKQANITVFNNSKKGIQGLAVSSGSFTVIDDDVIHDKPRTLVAPYASYTIQFSASNVRAKLPLVISGVIYEDDSEAGDVDARQRMRNTRAQQKEKRLSESNQKNGN